MKNGLTKRRRRSRLWHRWLGGVLFVPLLFVSVTGVLLNHADDLGLDQSRVETEWILRRYGMGLSGKPTTYQLQGSQVSAWGGQLFWNDLATDAYGSLRGLVEVEGDFAVVWDRSVSLHDPTGALLERLGEESLPDECCAAAGKDASGRLVIRTRNGTMWRFPEADLLGFERFDDAEVHWSRSLERTPEERLASMRRAYRGEGLPWSRLLMDLHSGRFFGALGRWGADLLVMLLIGLSITGLVLGYRAIRFGGRERDE